MTGTLAACTKGSPAVKGLPAAVAAAHPAGADHGGPAAAVPALRCCSPCRDQPSARALLRVLQRPSRCCLLPKQKQEAGFGNPDSAKDRASTAAPRYRNCCCCWCNKRSRALRTQRSPRPAIYHRISFLRVSRGRNYSFPCYLPGPCYEHTPDRAASCSPLKAALAWGPQ